MDAPDPGTTTSETRSMVFETRGPWRVAACVLAVLCPLGLIPIFADGWEDPLYAAAMLALILLFTYVFWSLALSGRAVLPFSTTTTRRGG